MTRHEFALRLTMTCSTAAAVLAAGPALAGCSESVPIGGHDASGMDDASSGHDGGQACGPTTCAPDEVCCNVSCGICVDPGTACPAIGCVDDGGSAPQDAGGSDGGAPPDAGSPPPCEAMDARGEGACRMVVGYKWNGNSCVGVSGCTCDGTDCDSLFDTVEACRAAYSDCSDTCGGLAGARCEDHEWCDYPEGSMCGRGDATGVCKTRPDACTEEYAPVCGCDRETYGNACKAHAAGVDISSTGTCESSGG